MTKRRFSLKKKLFFASILLFLAVALCLVGAEVGLRVLRTLRPPRAVFDAELGWRAAPHISRQMPGLRADGTKYDVVYESGENGFRFWGDPGTKKKRLLVVGDSYTEAVQVSNDKTWYALLHDKLGAGEWELWAYGMGGYGNLQEYLVLEEYLDVIKPDLFVWQWCGNDIVNNSWEFDSGTIANLTFTPRPYLIADEIELRYPREVPLLSRHSKLFHFAAPRVIAGLRKYGLIPELSDVDRAGVAGPVFQDALATTGRIVGMTRDLLQDTPTYALIVTLDGGDYLTLASGIATRHDMVPIAHLEHRLSEKRAAGVVIEAHDSIGGHWCEEGHAAVAELTHEIIAGTAAAIVAGNPVPPGPASPAAPPGDAPLPSLPE